MAKHHGWPGPGGSNTRSDRFKLTDEEVRTIRKYYDAGTPYREFRSRTKIDVTQPGYSQIGRRKSRASVR